MQAQWQIEDGAHAVVQTALSAVDERLAKTRDLPEVLYTEAPGAYSRRVLENIEETLAWLLWARRVVIDESLQTRTATLREIANASGVAMSTLQRWKAAPLPAMDDEGTEATGPGERRDRRKGDY